MNTNNNNENKMSLIDHISELRKRLLISVAALLVGFIISFYFAQHIYNFLAQPLADIWSSQDGRRMIATALHEQFFTQIKVAFFSAFCIAFPIIITQVWMFIAPALYKNEKLAFLPFLIITPLLFIAGGAFVYYFVLPIAFQFFIGFEQAASQSQLAIQVEPKVNEYLSLVMRLILAFGISFELPVALTLMGKVGLVSSQGLKQKRRYAIVLAFVAAAILTPPDPLSQIGLAIPIVILYEISIISVKIIEKNRTKNEQQND